MTEQHPITPHPELISEWFGSDKSWSEVLIIAARWGADQELEACCEYITGPGGWFVTPKFRIAELRAARRPKPPSLRKQAYDALDTYIYGEPDPKDKERTYNTIRRALEQLND